MNRGISTVLGNKQTGEPQVQGLRMSTILNNTRVRNVLDCHFPANITAKLACEGSSGSLYNTTAGSFTQVYNLKDWDVG